MSRPSKPDEIRRFPEFLRQPGEVPEIRFPTSDDYKATGDTRHPYGDPPNPEITAPEYRVGRAAGADVRDLEARGFAGVVRAYAWAEPELYQFDPTGFRQ